MFEFNVSCIDAVRGYDFSHEKTFQGCRTFWNHHIFFLWCKHLCPGRKWLFCLPKKGNHGFLVISHTDCKFRDREGSTG